MITSAPDRTEVGNYFVANYPPFSVWTKEAVQKDARPALASAPADVPLGLYLHIPFCRKRCHFCYFRVYTDKNASDVQSYLDVLGREWELYNAERAIAGRPMNFVYFGGAILEANGRAHRSGEIGRAYEFARALDFPQINIYLIAGMLGESDENW